MVEGFGSLQPENAALYFKSRVRNHIGRAITNIGIYRGQIAHLGTGGVFIHAHIIKRDVGRRFIDIIHVNGKCFGVSVARAIGGGHFNRHRVGGLMIKGLAVFQFQLTVHHFKAGVIHSVGCAVTLIRIGGGQIADNGAVGVFIHAQIIKRDIGRRFIHIIDRDGEAFGVAVSIAIRGRHFHNNAVGVFMVEGLASFQLQLAIDHLKAPVINRIGVAVACVRVGC